MSKVDEMIRDTVEAVYPGGAPGQLLLMLSISLIVAQRDCEIIDRVKRTSLAVDDEAIVIAAIKGESA